MQGTFWQITSQMAEAQRNTLKVQIINVVTIIFHLIVVLTLWKFKIIGIVFLFISIIIEWLIAGVLASKLYNSSSSLITENNFIVESKYSIFKEYKAYCLPLIPYVIFGFIYEFGDRWMLQNWGGATSQSFYTLSYQFASVALIATSSILRIFWKEIAESYHNGDINRVQYLYIKISRILYFIAALFAGWAIPWTTEIIILTLGNEYINLKATLMLMFLYPVHQTLGQIAGTIFYATEKTKLYALISYFFMFFSSLAAYFLLAPKNMLISGLGLSSFGLGIKMVIMQIIQVNVLNYTLFKLYNLKFDWLFQIICLILVLALGASIKYFLLMLNIDSIIYKLFISIFIYLILSLCFIIWKPTIFGLSRSEINMYINIFK